MRDISSKAITLRTAHAVGVVICGKETVNLIVNDRLPKGNLFDVARAAGFLAAKNTHNLIPHCHPVSIDGMDLSFDLLKGDSTVAGFEKEPRFGIAISGTAKSIGRTGIEMEMLTAVSVAALTIYDLLKPVDKNLEISSIRLLDKRGGKSDRDRYQVPGLKAAVLVCSDSVAAGQGKDSSGPTIARVLKSHQVDVVGIEIVADNKEHIQQRIMAWVDEDISFIFITGGTGLSPSDRTVEALKDIIEKEAPGVGEAMRVHGGMRTPLAMMSRSLAGTISKTMIVALPGSVKGVQESLDAILPWVLHSRHILEGGKH